MKIYSLRRHILFKWLTIAVIAVFLLEPAAYGLDRPSRASMDTLSPELFSRNEAVQFPAAVLLICKAIEKQTNKGGALDLKAVKQWLMSNEKIRQARKICFQDAGDEVQILADDRYLIRYARKGLKRAGLLFENSKEPVSLLEERDISPWLVRQIYRTELLLPRSGRADEVFSHIRSKAGLEKEVEIITLEYAVPDGEYKLCRMYRDGKLKLHPEFVADYEDLRSSGMGFAYTFHDGVTRWIDLAEAVAYRAAMHELDLPGRRGLGHGYIDADGKFGFSMDELMANYVGRRYSLVDDAMWLWYLHSYKLSDAVRYDNQKFLTRLKWIFYDDDPDAAAWREEFPALSGDPAKRDEAIRLALLINEKFFAYSKEPRSLSAGSKKPLEEGAAMAAGAKKMTGGPGAVEREAAKGTVAENELMKKERQALISAYEKVLSGEKREVAVSLITDAVILKTYGVLKSSFPLPGGGTLGERKQLGAQRLTALAVVVTKGEGKGELILEFNYTKESGKSGIVKWIWDGKNMDKEGSAEETEAKERKAEEKAALVSAYEKVLSGAEKEITIKLATDALINKNFGFLKNVFPLPDGREIGKREIFGARNLTALEVVVKKGEGEGELVLEFNYIRENGESGTIVWRWEGKTLTREISREEIERGALVSAYEKILSGEKEEVTVNFTTDAVISMKYGTFQKSFPLPDGGNLGEHKAFGAQKITRFEALVRKGEGEGQLVLEFNYVQESGTRGTMEWLWNGKELVKGGRGEAERAALMAAYAKVLSGEEKEVAVELATDALVAKKTGQFNISFPLPGGGKIGEQKQCGAGNLTALEVLVKKGDGEGRLVLELNYTKENGESNFVRWMWDGKELVKWVSRKETEEEELKTKERSALLAAYEVVISGSSEKVALDLTTDALIDKDQGRFQKSFPLPDGRKIREPKQVGAKNLTALEVLVKKGESPGALIFEFSYEQEGGKGGILTWLWDGKTFAREISREEAERNALADAYVKVLSGSEKEIAIKLSTDALINRKYGVFQWAFPLPGGGKLGEHKTLGAPGLAALEVWVKKGKGEEELILEFHGIKKNEKPVVIEWRWNGKELVRYYPDKDEVLKILEECSWDFDEARERGLKIPKDKEDAFLEENGLLEAFGEHFAKMIDLAGIKFVGAAGGKKLGMGPGSENAADSEKKEAVPGAEKSIAEKIKEIADIFGWDFANMEMREKLGMMKGEEPFAYFKRNGASGILEERIREILNGDDKRILEASAARHKLKVSTLVKILGAVGLVDILKKEKRPAKPGENIEEVERRLDEKGVLDFARAFCVHRPKEFGTLLSILLPEYNFDLDELNRMISGFRSLNVNEVAMLHTFAVGRINLTELFIRTMLERAALFSEWDSKTQEVFISMFSRVVYVTFSKAPEESVRTLRERIDSAIAAGCSKKAGAFLERLYKLMKEEYIDIPESFSGEIGHIDQSKKKLNMHQLVGAYRLKTHDRFALLDGTRTGKTLQVLAAMDPDERTLVVSPAGVLDTWHKAESESFSFPFKTIEASDGGLDEDLKSLSPDERLVVLLRGPGERRMSLLQAIRGRKKTIIHVSFDTLREMDETGELELLLKDGLGNTAVNATVVDEWQNAENFVENIKEMEKGEREKTFTGAGMASAVQKLQTPKRWIISASPYRSDPHKLFAMFRYLRGDDPNAPDWARDGRVFRRSFAEDMEGLRWLNGEISELSIRRTREDVWDIYADGLESSGVTIPEQARNIEPWEYEMPPEMARESLSMVKNFKDWVTDVYNPKAPKGKRLEEKDLNILEKIKLLRWLPNHSTPRGDGLLDVLGLDTPYWDELDKCVNKALDNPEKKLVVFAQNTFMIEAIMERYRDLGCVQIDGEITGFQRDETTGQYIRDANGRRITRKTWNQDQFQENPAVRMCVANIRAGVGIDLSRGDAVIYAQMPETYEQMYQSQSRILGPSRRDHPRKDVEMYFMCAKYPASLEKELKDEEERMYYRTGTIDEVQYRRLSAQKTRFGIIMDGGVSDTGAEDPLELLMQAPQYIDDMSMRSAEDLSRNLTARQAAIVRAAGYLGHLIALANASQREAIYRLIKESDVIKTDITPLSRELSGLEKFNMDDLVSISEVTDISNNYVLRKVLEAMPGLIKYLYDGKMSLLARIDDVRSRFGMKIEPRVITAALALLYGDDAELHEKRRIFFKLCGEISGSDMNKGDAYEKLLAGAGVFRHLPVSALMVFEEKGVPIQKKLKTVSDLAIMLAFTPSSEEIEIGEPAGFDDLMKKVEEGKPSLTAAYFRAKGFVLDTADARAMDDGLLTSIASMAGAMERGEREATDREAAEKFAREIKRLGEITTHIADGTYGAWRNAQEGERLFGPGVEYLKEDAAFWEAWAREEKISLGDLKVKMDKHGLRRKEEFEKILEVFEQDPSVLKEIEGDEAGKFFEEFMTGRTNLDGFRTKLELAGKLINKIFNLNKESISAEEDLTQEDKAVLRDVGAPLRGKASELNEKLVAYKKVLYPAVLWMELVAMARGSEPGKVPRKTLEMLLRRITVGGISDENVSRRVRQAQEALEGLLDIEKITDAAEYKDTEILITSDPELILRRGMLDKQMMNCFQHDNDPEFVRMLIDDLGSRNKMLIVVKSKGKYRAVSIAKIKSDGDGNPVIFLERILARKGRYDFSSEIIRALIEKKSMVMPRSPPVVIAYKGKKGGADGNYFATGGYGEDEYSEAHFGLRKNYWYTKDGAISTPKTPYWAAGKVVTPEEAGLVEAPEPKEDFAAAAGGKKRTAGPGAEEVSAPKETATQKELKGKEREALISAYKKVLSGEAKEVEIKLATSALIDKRNGVFQMSFPLPDGGKMGEARSFGAGNLTALELRVKKGKGPGALILEFNYTQENGKAGTVTWLWDGEGLIKEVSGEESAREKLKTEEKDALIGAYKKVLSGEAEEVSVRPVTDALISKRKGRFQKTFPLPDGGKMGGKPFGAGNLTALELLVKKGKGPGALILEFNYTQENGKAGTVTWLWDGKVLAKEISEEESEMTALKDAYEKVLLGEAEEVEIKLATSALIDKRNGVFQMSFPLPDGGKMGEARSFGAGNLTALELLVKKGKGPGALILEFNYTQENGKAGTVTWLWDGKVLAKGISEEEIEMTALKDAYKKVLSGEMEEVEIKLATSALIGKRNGKFPQAFPLPDGGKMGEARSFGAGNLTALELLVKKGESPGALILEFNYTQENGNAGTVTWLWDGKVLAKGISEEEIEMTALKDAYKKVLSGEAEEASVKLVTGALIDKRNGRFQTTFPFPDGGKMGEARSFGAKNLTALELLVKKGKGPGALIFEFSYTQEGGNAGTVTWLWDGRELAKEISNEEIEMTALKDAYKKVLSGEAEEVAVRPVTDTLISKRKGRFQKTFPLPDDWKMDEARSFGAGNLTALELLVKKGESPGALILEFNYTQENGGKGIIRWLWNGKELVRYFPGSDEARKILEECGWDFDEARKKGLKIQKDKEDAFLEENGLLDAFREHFTKTVDLGGGKFAAAAGGKKMTTGPGAKSGMPVGVEEIKLNISGKERTLVGLGHGRRTEEEFLAVLKQSGVTCLVDLRTRPMSRFNPQFNKRRLEEVLANAGIRYVWMGDELGGMAEGYDDDFIRYMADDPDGRFTNGMEKLEGIIAEEGRAAVMCSETMTEKCHRRYILEYLNEKYGSGPRQLTLDLASPRSGASGDNVGTEPVTTPLVINGPYTAGYVEDGSIIRVSVGEMVRENSDSLKEMAHSSEKILIRLPAAALESIGKENAAAILSSFKGVDNVYIEIFGDGVNESTYSGYGIEKRTFDEKRTRKNTITIFDASPDEKLNYTNLTERISRSFDIRPEETILMPIGVNTDGGDASGIIRGIVLGLRLVRIARGDVDKGFIDETINGMRRLCDETTLRQFDITADDLKGIAAGNMNRVISLVNKMLKLIPMTPINPEVQREMYAETRKALIAA